MTNLDSISPPALGAMSLGSAAKFAKSGIFGQAFQGAVSSVPATVIPAVHPSTSTQSDPGEGEPATSITGASSKLQTALADFMKEARKTPAERAHDQILAKHHLSEDGYKALSPDARKLIDQEILTRTRLLMKNSTSADPSASSTAYGGDRAAIPT